MASSSRLDRTDDTAAVLKIIASQQDSEDAVNKEWQGVYVADATTPAANKMGVDASGHAQVDIAADSAGLATSANQLADGHNVTVDNAGAGAAVNVQDGGNDISVDNAGTFATQDSEKVADNAAFTDGTTPVQPTGGIFDEVAGTALTENDIAASRIDSKRAQVLVIEDETTRGRRATVTASNELSVIDASTATIATNTTDLNNAIGTDGAAGPTRAVSVAGTNAGNLQELEVNADGELHVVQDVAANLNMTEASAATIATNTTDLNNAIGTDGAAGPTRAVSIAGTNAGNLQEVNVDATGDLQVDVLSFPDNEPFNVAQVGGTATDTNAGAVGAGTQRVVLANNEALPAGTNNIGDVDVNSVVPVTATGTHTAGSTAITIDVGGYGSVGIQLSGTWTATVGFDATVDGTNWQDLEVVPSSSTTAVTTSTANGIWYADVGGLNQIRTFTDAFTSGTVQVDMQANVASGKASTAASTGGTSATDDSAFTGGSTSVTPIGAIFDATPPTITDGNVGAPRMDSNRVMMTTVHDDGGDSAMDDANNALRVNVVAGGGTGGTAIADESGFTEGTTNFTPVGGVFNDTHTVVTEDQAAAFRMSDNRNQYITIRDGAGNERGVNVTAGNALSGDLTEVGGTAVVTGGVAGTQGVGGLAADGAALAGNPVLVAGSDGTNAQNISVDASGNVQTDVLTVPANQTVDVNQVAGTVTSVNNGTADAGTQRVAIASDNTAFVQPLTATGTMTAGSQSVTLDVDGYGAAAFQLSGTWTATVGFDATVDGTNWINLQVAPIQGGLQVITATGNGIWSANCGGFQQVRVFTDAFTSGTVQADLQANIASGSLTAVRIVASPSSGDAQHVQGTSPDGSAPLGNPVQIGGSDGTNMQVIRTSTVGRPEVVGAAADGAAVTGNPVLVAGQDGTNAQSLSTNATGHLNVVQPTAADLNATVASITTSVTPGTAAANLGKPEDGPHTTGDVGVMALGVANEANTAHAADNDYVPLGTDTEGSVRLVGNRDHDAIDAGEVVKVGGVAVSGSATPTSVASADRSRWIFNQHGIPYVMGGHPNLITREYDFGTAAQTDVNLAAALVAADERVYVTRFEATNDDATTVAVSVRAGFGTASVPTASATGVSGMISSHPGVVAGSGIVSGDGSGIIAVGGAGEEPRITTEAATSGNLHVIFSYYLVDETP